MNERTLLPLSGFNIIALISALLALLPIGGEPRESLALRSTAADDSQPATAAEATSPPVPASEQKFAPLYGAVRSLRYEDPFLQKSTLTSLQHFKSSSKFPLIPSSSDVRIKFLLVLLNGDDTKTAQRHRINTRRALELAVASEQYESDIGDFLFHTTASICRYLPTGDTISTECVIPLSFYSKPTREPKQHPDSAQSQERRERLAIFWIDQGYLGSKPIHAIQSILCETLPTQTLPNADVSIIGPVFSKDLQVMVDEVLAPIRSEGGPKSHCSLKLFSPAATSLPAAGQMEQFSESIPFHSTIKNDTDLSNAIVNEIRLRRRHHGQMVLFTEQGATSPENATRQIVEQLLPKGKSSPEYGKVFSFHYTPSAERANQQGGGGKETEAPKTDEAFKYFTQQFSDFYDDSTGVSREDVSAVVIIGDSEADRIAIYQVLRSAFPNATFFTQDLHRIFFDEDVQAKCRGLVVVSRGTLTPLVGPAHQRIETEPESESDTEHPGDAETLSFDDVYQTASFAAVRYAITGQPEYPQEIAIFEIGLKGPYQLNMPLSFAHIWQVLLCATGIALLALVIFGSGSLISQPSGPWSILQRTRAKFVTLFKLLWPGNLQQPAQLLRQIAEGFPKPGDTASHSTHERGDSSWFVLLFQIRVELAISSLASAIVWKQAMLQTSVMGLFCQGLYLLLILITIILILFQFGSDNKIAESSSDSEKEQQSILGAGSSWFTEMICFVGLIHTFFLFSVIAAITEIREQASILHEPFSVKDGISLWPVFVGFILVAGFAIGWLRRHGVAVPLFDRQASMQEQRHSHADKDLQETFRNLIYITCSAERVGNGGIRGAEPKRIGDDIIDNVNGAFSIPNARFAVILLLLIVTAWQLPGILASKDFPSWGLFPLPPARGGIELALGMFLSLLSLLLTLLVAFSSLLRVRVFANAVKELRTDADVRVAESRASLDWRRFRSHLVATCNFIQHGSHSLMDHALRAPSILLLGFALSRFPFLEAWPINSITLISVAGLPIFVGLVLAVMLRSRCRAYKNVVIETLELHSAELDDALNGDGRIRAIVATDGGQATSNPSSDSAVSSSERQANTEAIEHVKKMQEGAFGPILSDPVLGSMLIFSTTILQIGGLDVLNFLITNVF